MLGVFLGMLAFGVLAVYGLKSGPGSMIGHRVEITMRGGRPVYVGVLQDYSSSVLMLQEGHEPPYTVRRDMVAHVRSLGPVHRAERWRLVDE